MDIPFRKPGKQSREQKEREEIFAAELIELAQSVDFKMSSRGWCYYLEGLGLVTMTKAEFDKAEHLINSLREEGVIPIDIVAVSQQRVVEGLEDVSDYKTAKAYAGYLRDEMLPAFAAIWTPESQWETQPNYVEIVVEKIDLVGLFSPVAYREFGVTVTNMQGWNDLLTRAEQMPRFVAHYKAGRQPIVLAFTDHDPDGLRIASLVSEHYDNLANVRWMDGSRIDWTPGLVRVERIGLDYDMIQDFGLTWIDGLVTSRKNADGSKRDLSDTNHPNHYQPYVQDYLNKYDARKVEANALVARIAEARQWLRGLLPQYIDQAALKEYRDDLEQQRKDFLDRVRLTLRN